jgi:hypothetical protein
VLLQSVFICVLLLLFVLRLRQPPLFLQDAEPCITSFINALRQRSVSCSLPVLVAIPLQGVWQ